MELDQLRAFVAVARHGSFTRAATEMHLSQPAISRRVGLLEHELEAPLFERVPGGARLTPAGEALFPYGEAVMATAGDAQAAVAQVRDGSHGTVRLSIVGTLASTTLTEHLRELRLARPGVDLRIETASSATVSEQVRRGDVALGLRYEVDRTLDCTPLFDEPLVPVCGSDHLPAPGARFDVRDLRGQTWVAFPPSADQAREPYSAALRQRLAAVGVQPERIVAVDSLTAQKRMVAAGFGFAFLPASSLHEERRAGTLHVLPVPAMHASIKVVMVKRRDAFRSGAMLALIETIERWAAVASSA